MKYKIVESVEKKENINHPVDDNFTLSEELLDIKTEKIDESVETEKPIEEDYNYSEYDKKLLVNRAKSIAKAIYDLYNSDQVEAQGELPSAKEIAEDLLKEPKKIDMYAKFLSKIVGTKKVKSYTEKLIQELASFKKKLSLMKPQTSECLMKVRDIKEGKEIDRQVFASLEKLNDGGYSILNDGYFVARVFADDDDDAKAVFKKFLNTDWKKAWKDGTLPKYANDWLEGKKSIKKLWKEKAQGKYHIGCIFPNDTPYGKYSDKKCYLSKVKKNGEYEFTLDHTYAKDFSEQKADEYLKKLKDEFGGKIKNESLERKLNESMDRNLFWSNSMTYDWFSDKATDEEILEYFEENDLDLDDFIEYDEDDNPIEDSYDYDAMRDWLCKREYVTWNDQDWEDLKYNIIPELESQIQKDFLIIDGEKIKPGAWRSSTGRERYYYWFDPICEKIQDYYGNAEIYLDEDGNLEGWYTIPSNDAGLYRLARNIPEVVDAVKEELEFREEYQDDEDFDGGSYPGVNGKDLWLAVLEDTDLSEVDFDGLERWLVPIKKPW